MNTREWHNCELELGPLCSDLVISEESFRGLKQKRRRGRVPAAVVAGYVPQERIVVQRAREPRSTPASRDLKRYVKLLNGLDMPGLRKAGIEPLMFGSLFVAAMRRRPAPPVGPTVIGISPAIGFTDGFQDATIQLSSTVGITAISLKGQAVQYWDVIDSNYVHVYTAPTSSGNAGVGDVVVTTVAPSTGGTGLWTYKLWTTSDFTDSTGTVHTPTFKADETNITQAGGLVSAWPDQTGSGFLTPTQSGAARPIYDATGGPNGNPCITGTGTQFLDCGTGTPSTTKYLSVLCVFKATAGAMGAFEFLIGKQTSTVNWAVGGNPDGSHTLTCWADSTPTPAFTHMRIDDGNWHWCLATLDVTSMSSGEGTVRIWLDGECQQSRRCASASAIPNGASDHVGILGVSGVPMHGSMSMAVCWDALPGETALRGMSGLMLRQYGFTSNPVLHSSSPGVGALAGADLSSIVDSHGNLDVQVAVGTSVVTDSSTQVSGWLWQATLDSGNTGIQYDSSTDKWFSIVNGTTVLTLDPSTPAFGSYWLASDVIAVRQIYKPTTQDAANEVHFLVHGCWRRCTGLAASGGALSAASAATLGSAIGGGSAFGATSAALITRSSFANTSLEGKVEGLLGGDSMTSRETKLVSVDRYFYTDAEATFRPGIRSIAVPVNVFGDQQTAFENDFCQGDPTLAWILTSLITNDAFSFSESEATIATAFNAYNLRIKTSNPFTIYIFQMCPPNINTGGSGVDAWRLINSDLGIPGYVGGTQTILNIDYIDGSLVTGVLNDTTDQLAAPYVSLGGRPHLNAAGSSIDGSLKHAAVRHVGRI